MFLLVNPEFVFEALPSAEPISISWEPALEPMEPLAPDVAHTCMVGIPEDLESIGF